MTTQDGGRYQLTSRFATGGMGEVWRAEDTVLDREVAVKVLKQEYADDPTFRARFEAEARNAAALHHPNVASVFDVGELLDDDGSGHRRPFIVMELVPGQPLSVLLRGGEPMPPERASEVVAQAADAIAAAHAIGIVHRDVKPANLLVTPDGIVKITDFGIARAAASAAITQTGQIIGTPHYISPEQAEGRPATEASDIYALGVVLYECLAGQRPFSRDTPIQVALAHIREEVPPLDEAVPARLRAIVDKALAKDPAERFATAGDMAVALRGGDVPGLAVAGAAAAAPLGPDATQILERPTVDPTGTAPVDGPGDDGEGRRRGLPPWWPWAAAAAAVLALVVGIAAFAGDPASEPAVATEPAESPAASAATSAAAKPADDRVRVRESDYLGRELKDVKKELEGLGFEVEEEKVAATSPDQLKGTVGAVSPSGLVEPESTVTVGVWDKYEEPDPVEEYDGGGDKPAKGPEKEPPGKAKGKD
ncbi:MAG TPA: protein kinase [Nocardioidaceae bacterium]|nr:protein kinase [Nocardioidaceae bacterium]